MRDLNATVGGALHRAEDIGAGGGARESDIEAGTEGTGAVVHVLNHEVLAIHLSLTRVDRVQIEFLEHLNYRMCVSLTREVSEGTKCEKDILSEKERDDEIKSICHSEIHPLI